jgi:tetratricopeptide (TPR) repeat protein
VKPPRWKSAELSLIPTGNAAPTRARIARYTSSAKRRRFSARAAPRVFAAVVVRRQELAHQVPVRAVDLHAAEAPVLRAPGREGEALDHAADLGLGERARRVEEAPHLPPEGDGRGRHGLAHEERGGLLARVVELHPEARAALPTGRRPAREGARVAGGVEGDVAGLAERRAVDHDVARHLEADAPAGPRAVERGELVSALTNEPDGRELAELHERWAEKCTDPAEAARAWAEAGERREAMGELPRAGRDHWKALELDPRQTVAGRGFLRLATDGRDLHRNLEQLTRWAERLQEVGASATERAEVELAIARVHAAVPGRLDRSFEHHRAAVALDPELSSTLDEACGARAYRTPHLGCASVAGAGGGDHAQPGAQARCAARADRGADGPARGLRWRHRHAGHRRARSRPTSCRSSSSA